MTGNNFTHQLKVYTQLLLDEESNWGERRESLQQIHRLFAECGAMDMLQTDNATDREAVWLEGGYAVSPYSAGMCLFEIVRTRLFVLGLINAITDLLQLQKERPIQVLDAGCGPYALLSLLASLYFTKEDVQFHLLDIHRSNMQSAGKLIESLELSDRFDSYLVADACTFQWHRQKDLNIVIAETMLNGLRKEPQVALTLHLAPQLCTNGIFIPEKISVDCRWHDSTGQQKKLEEMNELGDNSIPDYSLFEEQLCNVLTLTKDSVKDYFLQSPVAKALIPLHHTPQKDQIRLYTTINVYKQYIMHHHDSSLTAPITISQPNKNPLQPGTTIDFWYATENMPEIKWKAYS